MDVQPASAVLELRPANATAVAIDTELARMGGPEVWKQIALEEEDEEEEEMFAEKLTQPTPAEPGVSASVRSRWMPSSWTPIVPC